MFRKFPNHRQMSTTLRCTAALPALPLWRLTVTGPLSALFQCIANVGVVRNPECPVNDAVDDGKMQACGTELVK